MKFIEDKKPNYQSVKKLLERSLSANHWTNFGPVSQKLENRLESLWGCPVVMCCSGTGALFSLVNLHNYLQNSQLTWVVSSFSFYCCKQGPLQEAIVVDCREDGLLDLDQLPNQFDGIIVTNLFGLENDLEEYRDFCKLNDKILIIDSAASFHNKHQANEIISFHQTKPWGFGEGGCATIDAKYKKELQSIINFGSETDTPTGRWSGNYKLSDPASAFIWDRLDQYDPDLYNTQRRRVEAVAEEIGLKVWKGSNCGHVPILYPVPVLKSSITQKYYRPLAPTSRATDLYRRMINFPCHPGLAEKSDDWINQALLDVAS